MPIRCRRSALLSLLSLSATASLACGGEDATRVAVEDDVGALEPSPAPEPAPSELPAEPGAPGAAGPSFVLHSAVEGESGRLNYFTPVDSLSTPALVSYDGSLELPGRARLYAAPGVGHFAIGDAEGVSLQRYELVDGRFVPGAELSLQAYGVTSLGAQAGLFAKYP